MLLQLEKAQLELNPATNSVKGQSIFKGEIDEQ
jgi:hypothetical protein